MLPSQLIGQPRIGSGHVMAISDFAWDEHGSFCRIGECEKLTVFSESAYTVVHPTWVILGNRDHFENAVLERVELPSGLVLYWGVQEFQGSQYSHVSTGQLTRVEYYDHIREILPEALSYIGLNGDDLNWAVNFIREHLCALDHKFDTVWAN